MSKHNNLILIIISGLLAACSNNTEVRSAVQANDHHMSCAALEDEIQRMEVNRSDDNSTLHLLGGAVRGAMSISGVLPLAVAANVVKDEPDASEKRQGHLMTLYVSRGCGGGQTQMVMAQPPSAPVTQVMYSYQPAAVVYEEIVPQYESQREVTQEPAPRYSADHIHMTSYLFE